MPVKVHKASDYLKTPEDAAAYLNAALEEMGGDPRLLMKALRNVAEAQGGVSAVARQAKLEPGGALTRLVRSQESQARHARESDRGLRLEASVLGLGGAERDERNHGPRDRIPHGRARPRRTKSAARGLARRRTGAARRGRLPRLPGRPHSAGGDRRLRGPPRELGSAYGDRGDRMRTDHHLPRTALAAAGRTGGAAGRVWWITDRGFRHGGPGALRHSGQAAGADAGGPDPLPAATVG